MRRRPLFILVIVTLFVAWVAGCSKRGLVEGTYTRDYYEIPRTIPGTTFDEDPRFIVLGDNRTGWRAVQKFASRQAWATWWQLAVPFYQIYLLGNGAVGGVNRLRAVPDYGEREARLVRDAVYKESRGGDIDFILLLGDIVTDGTRPRDWSTFIQQYKEEVPVVTELPFFPVIGNHERANDSTYGLPNYQAVFDYPSFYVVEAPSLDMFCVDSDLIIDQYGYIDDDVQDALFDEWFVTADPARPAWLESGLRASKKAHKVVVMHHPPFSFAKHYEDWYTPDNGRDLPAKRARLVDMMYENGVRLVIASHDHQYHRNVLHRADGDMHFVVSGGAGTPLRKGSSTKKRAGTAESYRQQGLDVECLSYHEVYNYCIIEADADSVRVEVFDVPVKDGVSARRIDRLAVATPE